MVQVCGRGSLACRVIQDRAQQGRGQVDTWWPATSCTSKTLFSEPLPADRLSSQMFLAADALGLSGSGPACGMSQGEVDGCRPSASLAGGHARGLDLVGSPSSRAGPEGGDSLRLQAEFGKGDVRVSRGGGQRVGENPAVETYVVLGGQLAQLLGRCRSDSAATSTNRGRLPGRTAPESCGGHLVGAEQPVWRSNLIQNLADDLAWRGMGIHNRTSSSVSRLGLGPIGRDRGYERLSAASEMPFLRVGSVAAVLVSVTFCGFICGDFSTGAFRRRFRHCRHRHCHRRHDVSSPAAITHALEGRSTSDLSRKRLSYSLSLPE